jgi:hypothetical protein
VKPERQRMTLNYDEYLLIVINYITLCSIQLNPTFVLFIFFCYFDHEFLLPNIDLFYLRKKVNTWVFMNKRFFCCSYVYASITDHDEMQRKNDLPVLMQRNLILHNEKKKFILKRKLNCYYRYN